MYYRLDYYSTKENIDGIPLIVNLNIITFCLLNLKPWVKNYKFYQNNTICPKVLYLNQT